MLEVGMYIRAKDGLDGIGIVKEIDGLSLIVEFKRATITRTANYYEKASFDATDLIKIGDLVNGYVVERISRRDEDSNVKLVMAFDDEILIELSRDNLVSIVTKEQLELCKTEFI